MQQVDHFFGSVISSYSRTEAINDGFLVDIPINKLAADYGIKWHCAMTAGLFSQVKTKDHNDLGGVIWDLLTMFKVSVIGTHPLTGKIRDSSRTIKQGQRFNFKFMKSRKYISVDVVFSVEDMGPCWTFMLPGED